MINKELIDFISKRLNIDRKDLIEKDVMIRKILFHLMQDKDFSQNYVFKGGTCLTKCYFGYYRFSEDMDFTYLNQEDFIKKPKSKIREIMSDKINKLGELIEVITKKLDLDFKMEKENKRYFQFGGSNAFVTFKIWYNSKELENKTFVKIQVNHIEKLNYPIKELNIGFIIPRNLEKDFYFMASEDAETFLKPVKIKAYDLKEILIEKVRAILTRRGIKTRDFIDIYLIIKFLKEDINDYKKEIIEKTLFMLKYEKYLINLLKKQGSFKSLKLEDKENILLEPINKKDFDNFMQDFYPFLENILEEIKIFLKKE